MGGVKENYTSHYCTLGLNLPFMLCQAQIVKFNVQWYYLLEEEVEICMLHVCLYVEHIFCFTFMWEQQNKKSSAKKSNLHNHHSQNLPNWSSYVYPDGDVVKWNQKHLEAVVIVTLWRISAWKHTCPNYASTVRVKKGFQYIVWKWDNKIFVHLLFCSNKL